MKVDLKIWRQKNRNTKGELVHYHLDNLSPNMSFLEMLDVLNDSLVSKGDAPVAFDSDCREGICGMCGLLINGKAHGPLQTTTTCQLHMRSFKDGSTIIIEPWRAKGFPIIKDLVVDRSSFDKILQAGGYVSVNTGGAPDGNALAVSKKTAELAMDAAQCIGCGACVASCRNASAMLFTSAKVAHLSLLPQGRLEQKSRVLNMVKTMDELGFGNCTNQGECEAVCPKEISITNIFRLNREYHKALITSKESALL